MAYEVLELSKLRATLEGQGAPWQAGTTPLSTLSDAEKRLRLGAVPPPGSPSLHEREQIAQAKLAAGRVTRAEAKVTAYPASYDLRNVNGYNYITPITDQGACGSCVAFGSTATVEGAFRVQRGNPNLQVDLSEAQLFYCIGRSEGATCDTGWWPDQAFDGYKNNGIADEACYPYTAGDQNCTNLCSDWQNRAIKINGWHKITNTADMKTWISTRGPLSACFTVYNDFFSYTSGVYVNLVQNANPGGHCVSVVGYDDGGGYWICKNSWGPNWGESGFFCIAYGQVGIDSEMWAAEGIVETMWLNNVLVRGFWAIDQDRNAYVYLDTIGWRKIAGDNDNIFHDLLAQLIAAKAAGRTVSVHEDQSVITQVLVL